MRFAVWQEQDAIRRRKIGFGAIPRSFHDAKKWISPHRSREH
jgi:hypothetical protein